MGEKEFVAGGAGQILLAVAQGISLLFMPFLLLSFFYYYSSFSFITDIVTYSIFLAFAILLLATMPKAARRFNGNQVGTVGAIFGLIAAVMGIVYDILSVMGVTWTYFSYWNGYSYTYYSYLNNLGLIMLILIEVFVGLTMVLLGSFFIVYRKYLSDGGLWLATGIIYIIAGAFDFTVVLTIVGTILTIVSAIMGAVCFFGSRALQTRRVQEVPSRRTTPEETAPETAGNRFCFKCGASITEDSEFCWKCGARQPKLST
jgi:hypothetical protein